jgi:hypothetical protein
LSFFLKQTSQNDEKGRKLCKQAGPRQGNANIHTHTHTLNASMSLHALPPSTLPALPPLNPSLPQVLAALAPTFSLPPRGQTVGARGFRATGALADMPGDQLVPPRQPSQPLSQVKSSARPCTRVGGLGMSKRTPCAHARTNAHLNGTHKRKRQQQSQTRSGLGAADWC